MIKITLLCALLLTLSLPQQSATAKIDPLSVKFEALLKIAEVLVEIVKDVVELVIETAKGETGAKVNKDIFDKLDEISMDLREFENNIYVRLEDLPTKLSQKWESMFNDIRDVQSLYNRFLLYARNITLVQSSTLKMFVEDIISTRLHQLTMTIEKIHAALTDTNMDNKSMLYYLVTEMRPEIMCMRNQPAQRILMELYKTIVIVDAQSLIMKLFAYGYKESYDKVSYEFERNLEIQEFEKRINKTYSRVKEALPLASRDLWRCDPRIHEKDVTYSRIQVFQLYINYEKDTAENTCSGTCSTQGKQFPTCETQFCRKQELRRYSCHGHLKNCMNVSQKKTFCYAPRGSDRLYEWMRNDESGQMYGRSSGCDKPQTVRYEIKGIYKCEWCLCTCVSDHIMMDRYFSLDAAVADVLDNKVVTGVRLKKKHHVFYIQIQQGKLLPGGEIDTSTVAWKDNYTIYNLYKYTEEVEENIHRYTKVRYTLFKANSHFYTVKWNQATVHLDNIEPQLKSLIKDRVVTGIRFKQINDILALEVKTSQIDFKTGKVGGNELWSNNFVTSSNRQLHLTAPDDPTKMRRHFTDTSDNQFVQFQTTDLIKDFSQYTIPFIDIQEVVTNPPVPLAGAGIFHKGTQGSGGFIGLKLIQYDFSSQMEKAIGKSNSSNILISRNIRNNPEQLKSENNGSTNGIMNSVISWFFFYLLFCFFLKEIFQF